LLLPINPKSAVGSPTWAWSLCRQPAFLKALWPDSGKAHGKGIATAISLGYSGEKENRMATAIIIGASSGIGREIAVQLSARGYRIGIAARREEALKELSQALGPEDSVFQRMDISQTGTAIEGFGRLCAELGTVDVVYLVAGTGSPNPELEWSLEEPTIGVNCLGFAALAIASVRLFARQGRGHLVGVTSVAAVRPFGGAPVYGASKTFQSCYLEALRYWAGQKRLPIHVTEVRPGFVDTAMMKAPKPFWVISPAQAAAGIIDAAERRRKLAYVPSRWWFVAQLMRILPGWLYARLG
jgi:short-subunit dehydrogenase